jgi:hypothetical protein
MSDNDVEDRAEALIAYIAETKDIEEYTESNDVIEYNTTMCPLP